MKNIHILRIIAVSMIIGSAGLINPSHAREYEGQTQDQGAYQLLILAPEVFAEELQPLVQHKTTLGMQTLLVTLEQIRTAPEASLGRDEAEQMKYYIHYAIDTYGISYVLLLGGKIGQTDRWYLPVRYVQMDNSWEEAYCTDLYFADIYDCNGTFSSWDSDSDGLFGEWVLGNSPSDTRLDLYPDISIGRLPCRSPREVAIVVEKIITYETTTFKQPWFTTMAAIAGDTYLEVDNPLWVGYEGERYANDALGYMDTFTPLRLFLSDGTFTSSQEVIDTINAGCGFAYFVGHGNPRTWGNHPPNDHEFVNGLQVNEMSQLSNQGKYPVCIVSGCHNCQFDVGLTKLLHGIQEQGLKFFATSGGKFWRQEWTPACWGWRMTSEPDGGSIVTYGATALGHTKEDKTSFAGGINELEVEMFRQYGIEQVHHAGDLLKNSVTWYLDTYPIDWTTTNHTQQHDTWVDVQVVQSYILFGDPSLLIGGYDISEREP